MLYIYNIFHEYLIRYSWEMFKVFIKKFQLYIVWSTGTLEKYWKQGCSFFVDFRSSGVKSIPLIEWIRKIDMPGKAKCIYYMWHKIISYGARGWVFLIEHSNSNEDAEKFNLKDSNYTLGVSKVNLMGFNHFSSRQSSLALMYNQKLLKLFCWSCLVKELQFNVVVFLLLINFSWKINFLPFHFPKKKMTALRSPLLCLKMLKSRSFKGGFAPWFPDLKFLSSGLLLFQSPPCESPACI